MTTLTGTQIANTYKQLLQVGSGNVGLTGSLQTVQDGDATNSPLQLSNSAVNINGTFQLSGVTLTASASTLNSVADLTGATGILAANNGVVVGRTLVGGTGIAIGNANGVAGDPTIALSTTGITVSLAGIKATSATFADTVSAAFFVGDGSGLTNVPSAEGGTMKFITAGTGINFTVDGVTSTTIPVSGTVNLNANQSFGIVSATNIDADELLMAGVSAANVTEVAAVSVLTKTNLDAITSINAVIGDGSGFATDAELAAVSATLATSINNSNTRITSVSDFAVALSATLATSIGTANTRITSVSDFAVALSATLATSIGTANTRITSVSDFAVALSATLATSISNSNTNITANVNAITSINAIIGDGGNYATSAELAATSVALATSIGNSNTNITTNTNAITSINSVIGDGTGFVTDAELAAVSAALATSIGNSNTRITSVSNFAVALSATMATSIGNSNTNITTNTNAITSINSVIGDGTGFATDAELAATSVALATSIGNSNTKIAAVSVLTSVNLAAITSINSVIGDGSGFATDAELAATSVALATSIGNSNTNITTNTNAITSINSVIGDGSGFATDAELAAVSATMATSIANSNTNITNNTAAITSITNLNTQDVTLAGTPDYISIINQVITRNQIDLAADVTGNLPVSNLNAGTGASGSSFWRGDGVWATPSGAGDVVGPASSTDNAIARFDATTGKLLQNSTVTISDAGAIAAGSLTLTTDLAVADGGTGASTFTANGVLVGNGTGAVTATTVGTSGQVLTSNGSGVAPTFQTVSSGGATDINGLSDGVTNSSGATVGLGTGALANDDGTANNNTALGYNALNASSSADDNTAVGNRALFTTTTGGKNTAVGVQSLFNLTSGLYNTGIGLYSGYNNTTGGNNTGLGYGALNNNTTGSSNVAVGSLALSIGGSAIGNSTAVGAEALKSATGQNNTALGYQAGSTTTSGSNQIVIGYQASPSLATVSNEITLGNISVDKFRIPGINFNIKDSTATEDYVLTVDANGEASWEAAVGGATDINGLSDALTNSSGATIGLGTGTLGFDDGTTNYNTALGYNALPFVTSGSNNVGIGKQAGYQSTTPIDAVYIGFEAAFSATTQGGYSVVIGSKAAQVSSDFDESVIIGWSAASQASDASSCVLIGAQAGLYNGGGSNVGIGKEALRGVNFNAISFGNVAIGLSSMYGAKGGAIGNTALGAFTLDVVDGGDYNTAVGYDSGDSITTGNNNTVIGYGADASSATVSNEITLGNTAITKFRIPGISFVLKDNGGIPTTGQILTADGSGEGYWATPAGGGATDINGLSDAKKLNSSTYGIGSGALSAMTAALDGNFNTAIGADAGGGTKGNGAGNNPFDNTFIGSFAGYGVNQTGGTASNVAIGRRAMWLHTGCLYNVIIGKDAGYNISTGSSNTGVGEQSLVTATTAGLCTNVGRFSGRNITTGSNNTSLGYESGILTTTGVNNTSLGFQAIPSSAIVSNEITLGNTAVTKFRVPGINFNIKDSTATDNYVLTVDANGEAGWEAAAGGATDIDGLSDARTISTGSFSSFQQIGLGTDALASQTTSGQKSTAVGYKAGTAFTGNGGTYLGYGSGLLNSSGGQNTFVGSDSGKEVTTGAENTYIGDNVARSATTGARNTFIGREAGSSIDSGGPFTTGSDNIIIGRGARASSASVANEITLGDTNITKFRVPGLNFKIKDSTATEDYVLTVDANGEAGWEAAAGGATDINGLSDGVTNSLGGTVGLGTGALANDDGSANQNTALGFDALNDVTSGIRNIGLGYQAGHKITTASGNIAIGYQTLGAATTGFNNVVAGNFSGFTLTTGRDNTFIGAGAGKAITTGGYNVFIGSNAGSNSSGAVTTDTNVGIGKTCLQNISGSNGNNTGLGYNALSGASYNASGNTALGSGSGQQLTTGTNNTMVGNATYGPTTGSNNTLLGYLAQESSDTVSNEITLGNTSISSLRCQVQTISALSDRRDKKDIEELPIGIDFINTLKPVKFTWNMRDGAKVGQQEAGFIAQDLDEAQIDADAEDYLSLVLKNNPEKLEASYGKLVPVLVKAVQELSAEIKNLKKEIENGK